MADNKMIKCSEFEKLDNIRHGFFTRQGGVSEGLYNCLNVGYGTKDSKENVRQNRLIISNALGVSSEPCTLYQVHSSKVITVADDFDPKTEADALVTDKPNIAIGVLTADCVPVLFADNDAKIIGAAHAGWKGAIGGVLENTISAMQKLGARNISAAIGPAIEQKSYEVGAEFYKTFIEHDTANEQFFIDSAKDGHYMYDIKSYVHSRLEAAGLKSISKLINDTCAEENIFFSYRRSCLRGEEDYGRQLSAIALT